MPSTATTRNRLEKQGTGENTNTWGSKLNASAFDLIDEALDGYESIAITGNYTLTATNYASDQARKRFLKFTGSVAANITLPAVSKLYFVWNATTQTLTFTTGGATTCSLAAGAKQWIACDGSGVYVDTSATAAASSATAAASSASAASTSASGASTSATNASSSASAASTSATNAANSATAAASSASAASSSASSASSSASAAAQSASDAAAYASSALPSQTGNSGKFLTTNGSSASWGAPTSVSGNAGTATTLQSARTIAIGTGATGTATSFNGSANITIPITAISADYISSGTLAVARGGTGATATTGTGNNVLSASPTLTGVLSLDDGTFSAPSLTFAADSNTGICRLGADSLGLTVGGVVKITIGSSQVNISGLNLSGTIPASASASGSAGDVRVDANYIYVCTATNTWKRAALTTW